MVARALTLVVAGLHLGFLILEMFLWTKPIGRKIFRQTFEHARISRTLAANQGLYNGFLSAGLVWGLVHPDPSIGAQILRFFLGCVTVAGVFGAVTVSPRILLVQALPAALALVLSILD